MRLELRRRACLARPDPTRTVLDNGAVVLAKQTPTTPAVTISLAMRAGSICDPADAPGATWLLSRVIDRGTATRSAAEIADELDSRGISLTIAVTRHLFSLVCTCLAEDFEPVLALLGEMSDVAVASRMTRSRRARARSITAIRQDEDNPAVRAIEALMALLYPDGHPYGRRTKGTVEIVEGLTRDQLVRLHAERFAPSELTAVVVGDVDAGRASTTSRRACSATGGSRAPPPIPLPPSPPAIDRRRLVIPMMNKAQADIAYGFTTIRARAIPAYYALLADEQRARPVRAGRPARRQHPRAAGHGVLRVQRRSMRTSSQGPLVDPRRRQPGERRSRGRVDRRGARAAGRARA